MCGALEQVTGVMTVVLLGVVVFAVAVTVLGALVGGWLRSRQPR